MVAPQISHTPYPRLPHQPEQVVADHRIGDVVPAGESTDCALGISNLKFKGHLLEFGNTAVIEDDIDYLRENGFIKLKNVFSPELLKFYGREITKKVLELNTQHLPMEERDTYHKAFLQIANLWKKVIL